MEETEINFEMLAEWQGISVEEARRNYEADRAELRRITTLILESQPQLKQRFEEKYEKEREFLDQRGEVPPDRDRLLHLQACNHWMNSRIRSRLAAKKACDIAALYGGEFPPGWDDMLPHDVAKDLNKE